MWLILWRMRAMKRWHRNQSHTQPFIPPLNYRQVDRRLPSAGIRGQVAKAI